MDNEQQNICDLRQMQCFLMLQLMVVHTVTIASLKFKTTSGFILVCCIDISF